MTAMARRLKKQKNWGNSPRLKLSPRGEERQLVPVSLPRLVSLDGTAPEYDAEDRGEKFAEYRVIRRGIEAWEAIGKTQSFDNWVTVGRALLVGRKTALAQSGANSPAGQLYSKAFCAWAEQYGFTAMKASTRSVAIELAEHESEIRAWRSGLPSRQQRRLIHPLSVTRRWRAATQSNGKAPRDIRREALHHWRRFVGCLRSLPAGEVVSLWEAAFAEAEAALR
jgi:hypothetical protein